MRDQNITELVGGVNNHIQVVRLVQWASRGLASGVYTVAQLPGETVHVTYRTRDHVETVALVYPDDRVFDAIEGVHGDHSQLLLALTHEGYTARRVDGVITGGQ